MQSTDKKATKKQIIKFWDKSYTCGCGLHVHPNNPLTNVNAIHIKNCSFAPLKPNEGKALLKRTVKKNTVSFRYKFLHKFEGGTYPKQNFPDHYLFLNLRTGFAEMFAETKRKTKVVLYDNKRLKRIQKFNTYNIQASDFYVNLEDQTKFLSQHLLSMGII